ncbi:MAG: hypothetical protein Ta2B_07060 [Termitinemataceae bacterium]|nr:MAG: hypothetical protein Ta2B_07060 [Termitinemataceae bacterium]
MKEIVNENFNDEYDVDAYVNEKNSAAEKYSKKQIIAVISFISMVVMTIIALKFPTEDVIKHITAEEMNLREGPNAKSRIIQQLEMDTNVKVLDDSQDWYFAEVNIDNKQLTGFVNSKYLKTETHKIYKIGTTKSGKLVIIVLVISIILFLNSVFYICGVCPTCKMQDWRVAVEREDLGISVERSRVTEYDRVETVSARSGNVVSYQDIPNHIRVKETYQNTRTYYQCPYCGYVTYSDTKVLIDREET